MHVEETDIARPFVRQGVGHSGEGEQGYEDRSCVMGVSFRRMDGPQECFNGWRHYALDWYADHETTVDPVISGSWGGNLAAFVDYEDMKKDEYAIVNVRDVYLQYNLADKHNWEVGERANEVTIIKALGDAEEPSSLLAGINMENPIFDYEHDGDTLVFEACHDGTNGNVRFFKISIHESGKTSACGIENTVKEAEKPKPTPAPTRLPTKEPTPAPTRLPTREPTHLYSLAPSPKRIKARQYGATENAKSAEPAPSPKDSTCVDSTLSFKVNTADVTCENVAKDSTLKSLYCRKGNIAYSECRKTCDSCGYTKTSESTASTSTTLRRTPLRLWDINSGGNYQA